jgi:2-oxoglutarate ferredoxin oxidoreductase subunit alpha
MEGYTHRIGGLEKDGKTGAISTDPINHDEMVSKRASKIAKIEVPDLVVEGDEDADLLVVGFGGTYGHLYSVVSQMRESGKKVALAQFEFINPLPKNTAKVLKSFKKVVVAEQNLGQFAGYLRMRIPGLEINQFNEVKGQPFIIQELVDAFTKLMED